MAVLAIAQSVLEAGSVVKINLGGFRTVWDPPEDNLEIETLIENAQEKAC